jgi:hypothetical protein
VQAESALGLDWRDAAAYAPLLEADRSLFAWEWLRRDGRYRAAAEAALSQRGAERRHDSAAAAFGLVGFEDPHLRVPDARPLWRAEIHPHVLGAERCARGMGEDAFPFGRLSQRAVLIPGQASEHLLLSDGLRAVRLDGSRGAFTGGAAPLRYCLEGLASLEPPLLTLRRLLALCRTGRFSRTLHPRELRARRWILMLRAWDAIAAGACQREIAGELLSRTVNAPRWRTRESSIRSQAQRLVQSARAFASGGYRELLGQNSADAGRVHSVAHDERNAA